MQEEIKQLKNLENKISETWELLKLEKKQKEVETLEKQMQESGFWNNQDRAKEVSQKHESLRKEIEVWVNLKNEVLDLLDLSRLDSDNDKETSDLIISSVPGVLKKFEKLEFVLLLSEKYDQNNAIITFHAGSGGTEAQDWAEMLQRMILRYVEKKNWKATLLDESKGQEAGIKSATIRVEGKYAFGYLKAEHGTHRLVRISPFDGDKSRHTSFASLEVIPEIEQGGDVEIDNKDLRIDTFMSSGKGGQSVNTTYSAVRIVHIPSGIAVQCQNERSQIRNKETAMKILVSKLQLLQDQKDLEEKNELRGEYKSAEWGNQIRSYVLHPYKMVKDLRSKFETTDPENILDGNLDEIIEAYLKYSKSKK